ncbi:MAG: hypothetical protein GX847_04440 [Clostridiales bacterium]|nr:hypothetical protein [Clostridiales bacterium]
MSDSFDFPQGGKDGKMKVVKIKKGGTDEGNREYSHLHHFSVRIKSGLLSYTDVRVQVYTNRSEISIHEVVSSIESQETRKMREIFSTIKLRYQNKLLGAFFVDNRTFSTTIGNDECKFYFLGYESTDYLISNPSNWEKYKRKKVNTV